MNVSIRRASFDDYNALCDLFDDVDAIHRNNLPNIFQKPDGPIREQEYYLGLNSDQNIALLVAEVNDNIIGFVHAVIRDSPAIPVLVPRRHVFVDSICVKSAYRGSGVGQMLMSEIHEWANGKNAIAIELNVFEFNQAAIAFYQQLGYEVLSLRMSKSLN